MPTADGHIQPNADDGRGRRPISVVYFGTPDFAVPVLRALASDERFAVRLVVTQPDRPAGRGRQLTLPAVKVAADELGIASYQTDSLRTPGLRLPIAATDADLFVVAAFGVIFGPKTLAIPRLGCVNLHASLLPAFRGASPISAAIRAGETETGISLMVMDTGLDTGPVLATATTPIAPDDTTETLTQRLAGIGADLAVASLPGYVAGAIRPVPQPAIGASITRPMVKADGWIDWSRPAWEVDCQVRAMWPWPRASTLIDGEPCQIHRCSTLGVLPEDSESVPPGTLVHVGSRVAVRCGDGAVTLERIQRAGGRPLDGAAAFQAIASLVGQRLTAPAKIDGAAGPLVTALG